MPRACSGVVRGPGVRHAGRVRGRAAPGRPAPADIMDVRRNPEPTRAVPRHAVARLLRPGRAPVAAAPCARLRAGRAGSLLMAPEGAGGAATVPTLPSEASLGLAPGELAGGLLSLAGAAGLALALKEIDSGRYVHLNAPMAHWLGGASAQPEALLGRTDADLLDAATCDALRAAERTAAAGPGPQHAAHRIELGGELREFSVVRRALSPAGGGAPRLVLALWRETTRERQSGEQLRRALAQIELQQKEAPPPARRQDGWVQPELRDAATGLYQFAHFDDQLRREIDLSLREHREIALVAVSLDPLSDEARALGAPARGRVIDALGRLLAGNTRAWTAPAASTTAASRCCCRASAWPLRIRAWRGCAASAPRRSSCTRGVTSASRSRWAWRAFRTPRRRGRSCSTPPTPRSRTRASAAATTSAWRASASSPTRSRRAAAAPAQAAESPL